MADYYTQFSEVLSHLTADEEAWLRQQLAHVHVFGDKEYADDELPGNLDPDKADWSGFRAWRDREDLDGDTLGFEYRFDSNGEWGCYLWMYAEESGEPESVAQLVQKFLGRFCPDQCWGLTFAGTCSKPRAGAFGGGAVFVTADEIKWNDAHDFVEKERQAFDTRHGKA
jgi:hypothetical protein